MFDALSEKLQATLADVRSRGTLTEDNIKEALREIRLALLEADVNFKVVKELMARSRSARWGSRSGPDPGPARRQDRPRGAEHDPGQRDGRINFSPRPPTVIMMAGLQGSGKTTATAKLARWLKEQDTAPGAVAACDVYRPAAVEQLAVGGQVGCRSTSRAPSDPVDIARWAPTRPAGRQGRPHRGHARAACTSTRR